jgi:hypothetical protein
MAENVPKMAENGENSQKKVHFSPEKAKNKSYVCNFTIKSAIKLFFA